MPLSSYQKYYANKFKIIFNDFRALCSKLFFLKILTDLLAHFSHFGYVHFLKVEYRFE